MTVWRQVAKVRREEKKHFFGFSPKSFEAFINSDKIIIDLIMGGC